MNKQKGFTIVEIAVVVLIVGLLGFIGLRVWGSYTSQELATNPTSTSDVREVTDAASLSAVEKQLENVDIVGSYEKELEAETF